MKQNLSLRQRLGLELQRQYRHNAAKLHPLRTLMWECTLRCNLACRHCGSDCRAEAAVPDMPSADILGVLDGLKRHVEPHGVFVIITGGEPLMRPDLEEVGAAIYRRGYPWGVVTNGLWLDASRLARLTASGMHSMTVSLDGFEADHNWLRRNGMSFRCATEAIGLLSRQGEVMWDVVTCVHPGNVGRLREMRQMMCGLGVRSWRLFSIFGMGRAGCEGGLQLSGEQYRGLLEFIVWCREGERGGEIEVSYACEGFLGGYEGKVRDGLFHCRSGIDVASIRCDGGISGCTSVRSAMEQGNIYRDDFWEVWQNRFQVMRDRSWARRGRCAECAMWRYCEGSGLHLYDDDGQLTTCHFHRIYG